MKTETLSIDLLRLDGDTQARIEVHSDTVDEYSELITANTATWPFPPLTVYHDGSNYFPADGFHRVLAAAKAGRASIPCDVKKGTARDARFYGMKANDEHGLRMSREDRRKNVIWMLDNYPEMTQANIAENAGVGVRTVERIVAERKPTPANPPMAGDSSSQTGVPSPPTTATTPKQKAAAKAKAKAKKAAAKEKAKADAAAAKAVKDKEKAEAAAEKARAKAEAAGARQKIKDDAAEAKAEALAAKEAAKAASLTTAGQITNIKSLIQQHIGKLVRHLADLNRLKPNRAAFDGSKKSCEGIKTW